MKLPDWAVFRPGPMRNMRCDGCGREYILWMQIVALKHRAAKRLIYIWQGGVVSFIVIGLAWAITEYAFH